jgi:hypothetical protein
VRRLQGPVQVQRRATEADDRPEVTGGLATPALRRLVKDHKRGDARGLPPSCRSAPPAGLASPPDTYRPPQISRIKL